MIYWEDYYGDGFNPYISRVSASQPTAHLKWLLMVAAQAFQLHNVATGMCWPTASRQDQVADVGRGCQDGNRLRVNNESPRVLVTRFASFQAVSETSITILADGATEGKRSGCSGTGNITRAISFQAALESDRTPGKPASR